MWVVIFVVITVTVVWSATFLAAIVNPKFSPNAMVGPALLGIIPLVSAYQIIVRKRNGDDK